MEKFWIIFVEHTDGGRHYRHRTYESAIKEAERLARLPDNIGKEVYIFEYVQSCRMPVPEIDWIVPGEPSTFGRDDVKVELHYPITLY